MRLAKTNHEEIDRLQNALNEVEWLHKELKNADFEDVDFSEFDIMSKFDKATPETFFSRIGSPPGSNSLPKDFVELQNTFR